MLSTGEGGRERERDRERERGEQRDGRRGREREIDGESSKLRCVQSQIDAILVLLVSMHWVLHELASLKQRGLF